MDYGATGERQIPTGHMFVCNIIYIRFAVSLWPQIALKAVAHNILTILFAVTLADYEHFKAHMLKESRVIDSELKCKPHEHVLCAELSAFTHAGRLVCVLQVNVNSNLCVWMNLRRSVPSRS